MCNFSLVPNENEKMSNDKQKMFRHHSRHEIISCDYLFLDHSFCCLHRIQIGRFAIAGEQQFYSRPISGAGE